MAHKDIQSVFRHANLRTTMDVYVEPITADVKAGMLKLSTTFKKMGKRKPAKGYQCDRGDFRDTECDTSPEVIPRNTL
jgi:hypothetical protein